MRPRALKGIVGTAMGAAVLALGGGVASAKPLFELLPHHFVQPPTTAQCEASVGIACYNPAQLQQAYRTKPLYKFGIDGRATTIVIVDAFGSPTIQSDLQTFDSDNGLPAPPTFDVITPDGPVAPFDPTNADQGSWAIETSLDVEYAHTMAPGANILLVETPVSETEGVQGFPQIVQAENYVINHHLGDVISQSFGATEQTFPTAQSLFRLRGALKNAAAHGVTVLGGSGDAGASNPQLNGTDYYPFRVNSWPSSDPLVTSVGGTQLHLDANGNRLAPDNVWNDPASVCDPGGPSVPCAGGGGLSADFARPFYQNGVRQAVGGARGTPDISLSAAVDGGVNVYLGFTSTGAGIVPGYYVIGGTSEATPLMSGIVSLTDQLVGHPIGQINPLMYELGDGGATGINDITSANNTVTFTNGNGVTYTVPGYNAGPGYDLASGLGTVNAPAFVLHMAALARGHQG